MKYKVLILIFIVSILSVGCTQPIKTKNNILQEDKVNLISKDKTVPLKGSLARKNTYVPLRFINMAIKHGSSLFSSPPTFSKINKQFPFGQELRFACSISNLDYYYTVLSEQDLEGKYFVFFNGVSGCNVEDMKIALVSYGCRKLSLSDFEKFQIGKTTKAEVELKVGKPEPIEWYLSDKLYSKGARKKLNNLYKKGDISTKDFEKTNSSGGYMTKQGEVVIGYIKLKNKWVVGDIVIGNRKLISSINTLDYSFI